MKWYDKLFITILCILLALVLLSYAGKAACHNDPHGQLCAEYLEMWDFIQQGIDVLFGRV